MPLLSHTGLPVGSKAINAAQTTLEEDKISEIGGTRAALPQVEEGDIDWSTFDFGQDEDMLSTDKKVGDIVDEEEEESTAKAPLDIETLMATLKGDKKVKSSLKAAKGKDSSIGTKEMLEEEAFDFDSLGLIPGVGEEDVDWEEEEEVDKKSSKSGLAGKKGSKSLPDMGDATSADAPFNPVGREFTVLDSWETPKEWLENPEFQDHVGVEVWSNYPESDFHGADETIQEEDEWFMQSMAHVMEITDMYLLDHGERCQLIDDRKHWEREMNRVLGEEEGLFLEDIPRYLTPDIDRGVVYSDDIIEMKGKLSLHVAQDDPHIQFKDDVFTHNTELMVMNQIGTIREQYEWQPTLTEEEWEIDESILPLIDPLIKYVNFAATLRSTKV